MPVDPVLVAPFLPAGERLTQERRSFGADKGLEGCTVYVDGNVVLSSKGEWHTEGFTVEEAANYPAPKVFGDGTRAVWDRGAAALVPCRAPEQDVVSDDAMDGSGKAALMGLETHVPVPEEGTEAAMRKFIGPYAKAYQKTLPCQEG